MVIEYKPDRVHLLQQRIHVGFSVGNLMYQQFRSKYLYLYGWWRLLTHLGGNLIPSFHVATSSRFSLSHDSSSTTDPFPSLGSTHQSLLPTLSPASEAEASLLQQALRSWSIPTSLLKDLCTRCSLVTKIINPSLFNCDICFAFK